MSNYFLSKSDFKIAQSCPAKLWYKKHQFPTATEGNEYMIMLADGGYMVGKNFSKLKMVTKLSLKKFTQRQ